MAGLVRSDQIHDANLSPYVLRMQLVCTLGGVLGNLGLIYCAIVGCIRSRMHRKNAPATPQWPGYAGMSRGDRKRKPSIVAGSVTPKMEENLGELGLGTWLAIKKRRLSSPSTTGS